VKLEIVRLVGLGETTEADALTMELEDVKNAEKLQEDTLAKTPTNEALDAWGGLNDGGHDVPELTLAHLTKKLCRDYSGATRFKAYMACLEIFLPVETDRAWTRETACFAHCLPTNEMAERPEKTKKFWEYWKDATMTDVFMQLVQQAPSNSNSLNDLMYICEGLVGSIVASKALELGPPWLRPHVANMLKMLRGLLAVFHRHPLAGGSTSDDASYVVPFNIRESPFAITFGKQGRIIVGWFKKVDAHMGVYKTYVAKNGAEEVHAHAFRMLLGQATDLDSSFTKVPGIEDKEGHNSWMSVFAPQAEEFYSQVVKQCPIFRKPLKDGALDEIDAIVYKVAQHFFERAKDMAPEDRMKSVESIKAWVAQTPLCSDMLRDIADQQLTWQESSKLDRLCAAVEKVLSDGAKKANVVRELGLALKQSQAKRKEPAMLKKILAVLEMSWCPAVSMVVMEPSGDENEQDVDVKDSYLLLWTEACKMDQLSDLGVASMKKLCGLFNGTVDTYLQCRRHCSIVESDNAASKDVASSLDHVLEKLSLLRGREENLPPTLAKEAGDVGIQAWSSLCGKIETDITTFAATVKKHSHQHIVALAAKAKTPKEELLQVVRGGEGGAAWYESAPENQRKENILKVFAETLEKVSTKNIIAREAKIKKVCAIWIYTFTFGGPIAESQ